MSWSGGTYRKGNYGTNGWTGDASLGIGIEAGRHDTQDDDFATGINACMAKDGSNAATGNLNLGANRVTNIGAGTVRTDAVQVAQIQDGAIIWCGTSGGSANAQTLTPSPAISAYAAGQMFRFIAGFTSTGALTLQVNGLGSPVTCLMKGSKVALGTLAPVMAGLTYEALYDGTNFLVSNLMDFGQFTNDAGAARLKLYKSRGTTAGTNTIVQNGDALGQIDFYGASGSEYTRGAYINATMIGTPGATNDMPTDLVFATTPDGSGTPTEKVRIKSSGNVGIGLTDPQGPLDVQAAASNAVAVVLRGRAADNIAVQFFTNNALAETGRIQVDSTSMRIDKGGNNPMLFITNSAERMRITGAGRVGIGTTSPNSYVSFINSEANSLNSLNVSSNVSGDLATHAVVITKYDNNNSTSQRLVGFLINQGATGSGQINANGASQAAFGSYSDVRLKENITDLPSQLVNIMALRPVEFDYKDGSGHQIGFVAQEVEDIYPDLIGDDGNGYLTLSGLGKNEARMIKAFQEFAQVTQGTIAALEARVAALEGA